MLPCCSMLMPLILWCLPLPWLITGQELRQIKKIKKSGNELTIELVKNVDIAAALGQRKKEGQFMVGFALETHNEASNAREKLRKKNLNMIVLNSLNDNGAGFRHDTNKITVIEQEATTAFELKQKSEVAQDIVNLIWDRIHG